MNVNFGLFPPLAETPTYDQPSKLSRAAAKAQARKSALSRRALVDLELWIAGEPPAVAAE
jgi:methylenetetrahydrofolate--tRNA-(uracil-5-)-methyltransferase